MNQPVIILARKWGAMLSVNRKLIVFAGLLALTAWGCTEINEENRTHLDNWAEGHQAKMLLNENNIASCTECHGSDLAGSETSPGCSEGSCHHGDTYETDHQAVLRDRDYAFDACQACHGEDLSGVGIAISCGQAAPCHAAAEGETGFEAVSSCDTCHGSLNTSPFADVYGDTDTSVLTVGMHTDHYTSANGTSSNVSCNSCHVIPDSLSSVGHIDGDGIAEVDFSSLPTNTIAGAGDPSWDRTVATCANIYCHGNFAFGTKQGENLSKVWTEPLPVNEQCGSCHLLPPTGHFSATACGVCHSATVGSDNISIVGPDRHINGTTN